MTMHTPAIHRLPALLAALWLALLAGAARAYPLDGDTWTGIARLEGYRLAQEGKARARRQPPGALLPLDKVDIRLRERPDLTVPPVDEAFTAELRALLGADAPRYSISLLDLTDRDHPVYAAHRETVRFNPGSVGKLAVAIGVFHELARAFPDPEVRAAILRDTEVVADRFIHTDHHKVPFWDARRRRMTFRPLRVGDRASLWTYLDWMLSASSNAAAAMVQKQLMLMRHFGTAYPPEPAEAAAWFRQTKPAELARVLRAAMDDGLRAAGVDVANFRQGGFFTREGKRRVPAGGSHATTRELLALLLRLEQGRVIDDFSSRELKRLLYVTQRRIRYASSPALRHAAVYFKSGSLYKCRPEPGFTCGKYRGNKLNLLNSVAIVESPAGKPDGLFYLVVVSSNILRKNAAVAHQTLATRIHRLLQKRHPGRDPTR